MSESLGSSVLDLSTDDSALEQGLDKAEGTVKSRMSRMGGMIGKATKVMAASFAAAGAGAIGAAFKTASLGDEVAKTATKLGITTDSLQEMRYWADRNGISASNLDRAVGRLNQRLGDGEAEGNKYVTALNGIGVATLDAEGKVRGTEEVMRDTIEALRGIEEPSIRSSMAAEIFGTKMARDLMPALQDGSLSLEEATERAHELGLVMDGEALEAAERFSDNWADIKDQISGFIRDAAAPLMAWLGDRVFPAISDGISTLRGFFEVFRDGEGFIDGVRGVMESFQLRAGDLFGTLLEAAQNAFGNLVAWLSGGGVTTIVETILQSRERLMEALFTVLTAVLEQLPRIVQMALGEMLPQAIETILSMAPGILDAAVVAMLGIVDALVAILPGLLKTITGEVLPALLKTIIGMAPDLLKGAITAFLALVLGLVKVLPDLIKTLLSDVLPSLITTLVGMIPELITAAIEVFMALVRGLLDVLPELLRVIAVEVAPALVGAVLDIGRALFNAGANLVGQIANGIRSAIGKVADAARSVVRRVRDFLPFSPAKDGPFQATPPDVLGAKISSMLADGVESVDIGSSVTHAIGDVALRASANGRPLRLEVDGRTFGEIIVDMLQLQNELTGPVAVAIK